jgi:hypothetical protein
MYTNHTYIINTDRTQLILYIYCNVFAMKPVVTLFIKV